MGKFKVAKLCLYSQSNNKEVLILLAFNESKILQYCCSCWSRVLLLLLGRLSSILFPPPQMLHTPPRQGIRWTESSTPGLGAMLFSYCRCWHDVVVAVSCPISVFVVPSSWSSSSSSAIVVPVSVLPLSCGWGYPCCCCFACGYGGTLVVVVLWRYPCYFVVGTLLRFCHVVRPP